MKLNEEMFATLLKKMEQAKAEKTFSMPYVVLSPEVRSDHFDEHIHENYLPEDFCGTVACMAGHIMLTKYTPAEIDDLEDWVGTASEMLDIPKRVGQALFAPGDEVYGIRHHKIDAEMAIKVLHKFHWLAKEGLPRPHMSEEDYYVGVILGAWAAVMS